MTVLSDTAALGIIGRIGVSSAKDPGPGDQRRAAFEAAMRVDVAFVSLDRDYAGNYQSAIADAAWWAWCKSGETRTEVRLNPRCAWPFPGRAPADDSEGGDPT